jgi:Ca2+-binding EF-hand superfamily protein
MGLGMMGGAAGGQAGPGSFLLDHFDEIDTDKNGQLSRDELKAWLTAKQQEFRQQIADHIKAADTNSDGMISLAEAKAALPMVYDHFDFLDANHDGQISQAEFDRLRDPVAMKAEVLARLQAADTNKDGKLDLAEMQVAFPALATRFSQIDKNNDGLITLDEIATAFGPH